MFTDYKHKKVFSDRLTFLWLSSVIIMVLLYLYHGFLVYNSDTIETVPYALWMSDKSLFPRDFHLSHLRSIIPNERWLISYMLHFFPSKIAIASLLFHAGFGTILVGGMLRFADKILHNFEFAILSVFVTLFTLYSINVGGNELYYNMFVPSLASKSIAIWACVYFLEKRIFHCVLFLILSSFFHPLVGFQLFIILGAILLLTKPKLRELTTFYISYLLTAGALIGFIVYHQLSDATTSFNHSYEFFDIVKYRIGHHFIPSLFPIKSVILSAILYVLAIIYYYKKIGFLYYFYCISLLGILIYLIGINLEIDIVLSSQWMKINIWLKFFSIIALCGWIQNIFEQKLHRIFVLVGFCGALAISIFRFAPTWDAPVPLDLYSWVSIQTNQEDLFLVPPNLIDFKARTLRSSYFDYKAMLHHKPPIYSWADRFQEVYGITIGDSNVSSFSLNNISDSYLQGDRWLMNDSFDYIIVPSSSSSTIEKLKQLNKTPVFKGKEYLVYKNKE